MSFILILLMSNVYVTGVYVFYFLHPYSLVFSLLKWRVVKMFSVLGKLAWFFKEHWKRYTIGIIALVIVNILELVPPRLLGETIDLIQFNELTKPILTKTIIAFFVVIIAKYFIMLIWDINLFGGSIILERKMRSNFMRHLLKMNPSFFSKNRSGDLMARATNDLKSIMMTAGFGILTLFDSTVLMVFII